MKKDGRRTRGQSIPGANQLSKRLVSARNTVDEHFRSDLTYFSGRRIHGGQRRPAKRRFGYIVESNQGEVLPGFWPAADKACIAPMATMSLKQSAAVGAADNCSRCWID